MPRIAAATIAEHIALQEAAVIDAAAGLFGERGVGAVSLGDIAEAVGLKRTSIYRYYPSKAHLVHAWFEQVMPPLIAASRDIAHSDQPAEVRLQQWVTAQFDFLLDPEHSAMIEAALDTLRTLDTPAEIKTPVGMRHQQLYATLASILGRASTTNRVRAALIVGLIRSSTELVRQGISPRVARRELARGTAAITAESR